LPLIGLLSPEDPTAPNVNGLRAGLRELGYREGQNLQIEYRWAEGKFERLPDLAAQLVRLNVRLIVAYVTQASLEAQRATSTIPIVIVGVADPVGVGLIASLSHPGANITGTSSRAADIVGKQLQLLKESVADVARVAALWNPANTAFQALQIRQTQAAARTAGVELQLVEARTPSEFSAAFEAIDRMGTRTLLVLNDALWDNTKNTRTLAELVAARRLVAIAGHRAFADAGGLMAYGPDFSDLYKRAAVYVDKILKGAKPADLPVEQPNAFKFVVNLKTAKTLGLTIPPSLLARADEVIE
jgi:putative ABC transport system substrate-binding protein